MEDVIFNYFKFDYLVLLAAGGVIIFLPIMCGVIRKKIVPRNIYPKYVELYEKRLTFLNASIIWLTVHYYLAIAAVVCTVNVIYINQIQDNNGPQKIVLYSVISILFTLGDLIIRPAKAANKYREAYIIVDELIHRIEYSSSDDNSESQNGYPSIKNPPSADEIATVFKDCEDKIYDGHS